MYPIVYSSIETIAKLWKGHKCRSADKWVKKMWIIYTMEYYLAMRKNEIWPFIATWMELDSVKWNKSYRQRQILYVFTLLWILKLTEDHGEGEATKSYRGREPNHKRLLKTENKLRVEGWGLEGGKGGWWAEEGTCWDQHWGLCGNQSDNKFHIRKMNWRGNINNIPGLLIKKTNTANMSIFTQNSVHVQSNPYQNYASIVHRARMNNHKICMEQKNIPIVKVVLKNKQYLNASQRQTSSSITKLQSLR